MRRVQESQKLVQWVNMELQMDVNTLDELKNGVALVQLIHKIAPDIFDLSRCDFLASTPYHYEKNFKLLQEVMAKREIDINRNFTVERLMEGEKQRDLFIFVSYLKLHYETFKTQRARRVENERKVTKKALSMPVTPAANGGVPSEVHSPQSSKRPPRPPPLSAAAAVTPTPKTTATLGGDPNHDDTQRDPNDNDGESPSTLCSQTPKSTTQENDEMGDDASPTASSNSATLMHTTKSAVKRPGEAKSPSCGSTARIAYDPVAERKRAMAIRRARVTTKTTSTRDTLSCSDQSSAPSARYSTGGVGVGRNGFPPRFRANQGRALGIRNYHLGPGGSRVGSARSMIGDWAESVQVPFGPTGSTLSNMSNTSRCSTPTTGGRRTPDPGTPHGVNNSSGTTTATSVSANAAAGGSGTATPGATPINPVSSSGTPNAQPPTGSSTRNGIGNSIPPSPLSAMHYQQLSFARNYSSFGGTNNTEITQFMSDPSMLQQGATGLTPAGSSTGTGGTTIRNLSSELSTSMGLGMLPFGGATGPSSTGGGGTVLGAGSVTGTVIAQQMAAAAAVVPGLAFDSIDCFVGANFFAADGKGWPTLGAPVVDVVGERVGQFFTHQELLAYKKELLKKGGTSTTVTDSTSHGETPGDTAVSSNTEKSSKKSTHHASEASGNSPLAAVKTPRTAATSSSSAAVAAAAAWDDFDALLDD